MRAAAFGLLLCAGQVLAQTSLPTPVRQGAEVSSAAVRVPISLRDASRNDRWLGLGVRDVRWAPDGRFIYFRWNLRPASNDIPDADPWFRTDRAGKSVTQLTAAEAARVPGEQVEWNAAGTRAAWSSGNAVFVWRKEGDLTQRVVALDGTPARLRFAEHDAALHFMVGESLYRFAVDSGAVSVIATRVTVDPLKRTPASEQLAAEARALSSQLSERLRVSSERARLARQVIGKPQPIPAPPGTRVENIQLAPDGATLTFRLRTIAANRPPTKYLDYADPSGYAKPLDARGKAGEPRDRFRLGILRIDPHVVAESLTVVWAELKEAGSQGTVPHGPWWSPDGSRAVVQLVGERDEDLWIAELSLATGALRVLTHDHDDAWLGGPPVQSNNTEPTLLEWLRDGSIAFATERSGWSHLARLAPDGTVTPLTSGAWEVRGAALSRDGSTWLLQTSEANAAEDQLYTMPALGGAMQRLTTATGRNTGVLSPDGQRVAILRSSSVAFADLFVRDVRAGAPEQRITESGTAEWRSRRLVTPQIVAIPHPDGKPVFAALYRPERPNPERAALIHVHGGGYRQFAHLGWSAYGWSGHLGLLHHFLAQGYTVLDFDYRGSAGFGRDYRTDIAGAMGAKDVDGAVAAARWLVREQGMDSTRIGIYGVSYGGFMTLMSQFRYPGVFAAGIARAPVTDWAHYSDGWTSRILGVPQVDSLAYRRSSPIYYAEGLRDHLLIEHGLVDDNVHFQDTARLVQRLLELQKDFEVMYYPTEPHVVESEVSRFDQVKRAAAFFGHYLLRR
ncbi:MAG: prolyl oligopeptidase family serine peptidase [Gemmatimonadaceae bacterium]|nr:prolyl oligopeptidase family serine peptidase [Gemmatimonadaceae bacterium]